MVEGIAVVTVSHLLYKFITLCYCVTIFPWSPLCSLTQCPTCSTVSVASVWLHITSHSLSTLYTPVLDSQRKTGAASITAELCVNGQAIDLADLAINIPNYLWSIYIMRRVSIFSVIPMKMSKNSQQDNHDFYKIKVAVKQYFTLWWLHFAINV